MKHFLYTALIGLAVYAAGCATTPQNPEQSIYAATSAYAGVLSIAVAYKRLPSCNQSPRPTLCSDAATVKKIQDADDKAYAALTAAQNIVRSSGQGFTVQTAIAAANEALVAFTSIASSVRVH